MKIGKKEKWILSIVIVMIVLMFSPLILATSIELFYEDWEDNNFDDWYNIAWTLVQDRKQGNYGIKCAAGANCQVWNLASADTTNADTVVVRWMFNDDDNDPGDVTLYANNSAGSWIGIAYIDAGSLGANDDQWYNMNWAPTSADYKHVGFSVLFWADPETGENYWIDNINISMDGTVVENLDVSACRVLGTAGANYTQVADITDNGLTGNCMTVTAPNITYDGNGFFIRSTANQPGFFSNQFNTTIKNTNVSMGSSANGFAIYFSGIDVSEIYNNTLKGYVGAYLVGSSNINVSGNTAKESPYGLYLATSTDNIIKNNNLLENDWGVVLLSDSNKVQENIITYNTRGVYLSGAINYNEISGNTISNNTAKGAGNHYGISLESGASNTFIANNVITDSADHGITISIGTYNNVTNNTVNRGNYGTYIGNNNYAKVTDNTLTNQLSYSLVILSSNWSTVINTTTESEVIEITSTSHLIFQNCNFTTDGTKIIVLKSNSINNTFINCTYSGFENVTSGSELIRKWYFDAQVNYTHNDTAVLNANVTAYNSSGSIQFSVLSDADGAITQQTLIEYINTSTTAYYNNHTVNATKTDWATDSEEIDITSSIFQQFWILSLSSCSCPGMDTNWEIDMSDNCVINTVCDIGEGNITFINEGTCLFNATINASKMTFDGGTNQRLNIEDNIRVNLG